MILFLNKWHAHSKLSKSYSKAVRETIQHQAVFIRYILPASAISSLEKALNVDFIASTKISTFSNACNSYRKTTVWTVTIRIRFIKISINIQQALDFNRNAFVSLSRKIHARRSVKKFPSSIAPPGIAHVFLSPATAEAHDLPVCQNSTSKIQNNLIMPPP